MAAEIVQQEGDVVNNEGVQISNENLEEKITFYATERQKLESLLQSVEFLLSTCGSQVTLIVVIVIHILAIFIFFRHLLCLQHLSSILFLMLI